MISKLKEIITSKIKLKEKSVMNINGRTFSGSNVTISNNGKVVIDGKVVIQEDVELNITIEGDVDCVDTTNGKVFVNGVIKEDVSTTNGDINCETIEGNVSTTNGDVRCKNIMGKVKTVNGDIG